MQIATLFSGGGGVEIGAITAGLVPIWGIEKCPQIAESYKHNIGGGLIVDDIKNVNPDALARPDVLWASPPCQAASCARRNGTGKPPDSTSGIYIIEFIKKLLPDTFILENVVGYKATEPYKQICEALWNCGYFWSHSVLDCADYGSPSNRKRLFLIGRRGALLNALPVHRSMSWFAAISDLIDTFDDSELLDWQQKTTNAIKGDFLVDNKNMGRAATIRDSHQPAPTIMASQERLFRCQVDGRIKALSLRAVARLQSFPDSYRLPESKKIGTRIIGNAVPPLIAQRLLEGVGGGI